MHHLKTLTRGALLAQAQAVPTKSGLTIELVVDVLEAFKPLLEALHRLQRSTSENGMRIRTALVTARSAPAHERAIRTLMAWGIDVDEAMFLGGLSKSEFLKEFEPDFFFDDQTGHCQSAASVAPTGHVVSGVSNKIKNSN